MKYNKSGTNLQGNANIIVRGSNGKIWQIKTTSLQSLAFYPAANSTVNGGGSGTFIAKCNVTDITDPNNPASVGSGGNILTVNFVDTGTGAGVGPDAISMQIYDNSGTTLMYSSDWDGTKTIQQNLGGGNLSAK